MIYLSIVTFTTDALIIAQKMLTTIFIKNLII